jgi:hypothetical protein
MRLTGGRIGKYSLVATHACQIGLSRPGRASHDHRSRGASAQHRAVVRAVLPGRRATRYCRHLTPAQMRRTGGQTRIRHSLTAHDRARLSSRHGDDAVRCDRLIFPKGPDSRRSRGPRCHNRQVCQFRGLSPSSPRLLYCSELEDVRGEKFCRFDGGGRLTGIFG